MQARQPAPPEDASAAHAASLDAVLTLTIRQASRHQHLFPLAHFHPTDSNWLLYNKLSPISKNNSSQPRLAPISQLSSYFTAINIWPLTVRAQLTEHRDYIPQQSQLWGKQHMQQQSH